MTSPNTPFWFLIATLLACGGDDGSNGDSGTTTADGSSTADSTMGFPTSDPDSDSSGVDPTLTTASGSDSSSTDPTMPTTDPESSGSDSSADDVCEPAGADSECYACQKESCCDAMTMCVEVEPNCACVLDCLGQTDDAGPMEANTCAMECNADYVVIVPSLMALATCRAEMCGGGNGCGGG